LYNSHIPKRIEPLLIDEIYHIYNRGVNKESIFFSERNYQFFLDRMQNYLPSTSDILAYCLMPNHFHILLQIKAEGFPKKSLHPFLKSYAMAINIEQDRGGPLFQGRFNARMIDDEGYLLDCVRYIHLNPVLANLVKKPEAWKYSSYNHYFHKEKNSIVNTTLIMSYFENITEFLEFHESETDQTNIFADD
jgi:putative transposase